MKKQPHYLRLVLQVIAAGVANAFILLNVTKWSKDSDTLFILMWAGTIFLSLVVLYFWVSNKERIIAIFIALALTILLFFVFYKFSNTQMSGLLLALGGGFGMVVMGGLVNGMQRTFFGSGTEKKEEGNPQTAPSNTEHINQPPQAGPVLRNCERCGHAIETDSNFCPECGYLVSKSAADSAK